MTLGRVRVSLESVLFAAVILAVLGKVTFYAFGSLTSVLESNLLMVLPAIICAGMLAICLIPNTRIKLLQEVALKGSFVILGLTALLGGSSALIDRLSLSLLLLTSFLIVVCILVSWESVVFRLKEFLLLLFILELFLYVVFITGNLFVFYIFFEGVLIPMFLLIGIWGSRERRIYASYQFFLYTFFGSVFMLLSIIYIDLALGSLDFDYLAVWGRTISEEAQKWLWLGLFFGLGIKVPLIPVHVWLPEAHVEASTAGSVLLAGILLKLGGYGFVRVLLPIFPYGLAYYQPLAIVVSLVSIIYSSCTTLRQVDLKKIIAYSSVAHMGFVVLGLSINSELGLSGGVLLMLSHGLVSSALFICVGILYDRYHTRIIFYYGGIIRLMPSFSGLFFFFMVANMGFPGTPNFVGELQVLLALGRSDGLLVLLALLGTFFGGISSLWVFNRVACGREICETKRDISDVSSREVFILGTLLSISLLFGIQPPSIL